MRRHITIVGLLALCACGRTPEFPGFDETDTIEAGSTTDLVGTTGATGSTGGPNDSTGEEPEHSTTSSSGAFVITGDTGEASSSGEVEDESSGGVVCMDTPSGCLCDGEPEPYESDPLGCWCGGPGGIEVDPSVCEAACVGDCMVALDGMTCVCEGVVSPGFCC